MRVRTVAILSALALAATLLPISLAGSTEAGYGAAFQAEESNPAPPGVDNLPVADPRGLEFSATVPADIQRDEGEPLIEIDQSGRMYTCGPTGFSQMNDYAQVSTDGGDQFHLLGEPPRGQISVGEGGGDCSFATALETNDQDDYQLAYTGLGPLTNFTAGTSPDGGATIITSPVSESFPAVDRQWNTFLDDQTVLLNYNQLLSDPAIRRTVVQKSTDGGLTYGPRVPATPAPPLFPGPMRTLPAEVNPEGEDAGPVAYFPWSEFEDSETGMTGINLSISTDRGDTWQVCRAAESPGEPALFPIADHDRDGNIYLAWTEDDSFHTYLTTLEAERLGDCDLEVTEGSTEMPDDTYPGFSTPVQVDRGDLRTTVFPWLAARGEPGRVAVTFYGTESEGNPNHADFDATWNVYVAQSLDALSDDPTFSQVKATTHPNHYDQICLGGAGCTGAADRSLVDFFAIGHNPVNGELAVVFNRAHKRPDDDAGAVSTPVVVHQIAGPSNGGGTVDSGEPPVLRTSSDDPAEDALADYSSLGPPPGARINVPAGDVLRHEVGPEIDLETGEPVEDGGFSVTMQIADLSAPALTAALASTDSQSLLWIFRFVDGFRYSAASARWSPLEGFTFGFNGYVDSGGECEPVTSLFAGGQCLMYPGDEPISGEVDQATGEITLNVPREHLTALSGGDGPGGQRPEEVAATTGSRMYDAAVFTAANPASPRQEVQTWLYPLDNSPAMDFLIPEPGAEALEIPAVSISDASVEEGDSGTTPATFDVTLSREAEEPVSVDYATEDRTAEADEDYRSASGTITFEPGETAKEVTVEVLGDTKAEPDETFGVRLGEPTNARFGDALGVGTILDDEPPVRGEGPDAACDEEFVPDSGFGDVDGNAHEDAIECIAWYRITVGRGDTDGDGQDDYDPELDVSRAQMASYIARLGTEGDLTLPGDASDAFDDDDGDVHEANINRLAAVGIVRGKGDTDGDGRDEYDPHGNVTRAQMASFIARVHERVVGSLPSDPPDAFDDDDGSVHEDAINALAELEVVFGRRDARDADGDGDTDERLYFPHEFVSRAQMASFLTRDLELFVDAGAAHPGGAEVFLDQVEGDPGERLPGEVRSNKVALTLDGDGCGLDDRRLGVRSDGRFTLTIPDDQTSGECQLELTAHSHRPEHEGEDPVAPGDEPQIVTYTFTITVR